MIDPLAAFVAGARVAGTNHPIPLVATEFDVRIEAGLAVVKTVRSFRNDEPRSIEATLTFPIPVHAALFALEARIDGRTVIAKAQRKDAARETYEDAIERGKATVLHEEVLRGVHMLSVGQIRPGGEVLVTATWAVTLTWTGRTGALRIPLTVGDLYGRSGLPDSDELVGGGPGGRASLTVTCGDGLVPALRSGPIVDGKAEVPLDRPIDLEVTGWTARDLVGRAADGREVVLRVEQATAEERPIHAALLIDQSASMGDACSGDRPGWTKHQAVQVGLAAIANGLGEADAIDLWQFDDSAGPVGSARGAAGLRGLIPAMSGPSGGTQIGKALAQVIDVSDAPDLLLVTDGKSHDLDIQALARTGRRISVLLVGDDSLEANVGHLAALTGGEIFVAAGADLTEVLGVALRSLRRPHDPLARIEGRPRQLSCRRAGMVVTGQWRDAIGAAGAPSILERAVAATAAGLALAGLNSEDAAQLAEMEGLVTHLTSLVLVDEDGPVQDGVPANRKIALPTPRTGVNSRLKLDCHRPELAKLKREIAPPPSRRIVTPLSLRGIGAQIDWDSDPSGLQQGERSSLPFEVDDLIFRAALMAEVVDLAEQLGLDPIVLVIALVARAEATGSRTAARLAKAILGDHPVGELSDVAKLLDLD